MRRAEIEEAGGDEIRLTVSYNTDDCERENWRKAQSAGKGFIRGERGDIQGRHIMDIPVEEAAMLRANYDLDWLSFERNGDRAAMKRLLARFPWWRCAEGGI